MEAFCGFLAARDPREPAWRAMHNAVIEYLGSLEQDEGAVQWQQITDHEPLLRAKLSAHAAAICGTVIRDELAQRLQADREQRHAPRRDGAVDVGRMSHRVPGVVDRPPSLARRARRGGTERARAGAREDRQAAHRRLTRSRSSYWHLIRASGRRRTPAQPRHRAATRGRRGWPAPRSSPPPAARPTCPRARRPRRCRW